MREKNKISGRKERIISLIMSAVMIFSVMCIYPETDAAVGDNTVTVKFDGTFFGKSADTALTASNSNGRLSSLNAGLNAMYVRSEDSLLLTQNGAYGDGDHRLEITFSSGGISSGQYKYFAFVYRFPFSNLASDSENHEYNGTNINQQTELFWTIGGSIGAYPFNSNRFAKTSRGYRYTYYAAAMAQVTSGNITSVRVDPFSNQYSNGEQLYIAGIVIGKNIADTISAAQILADEHNTYVNDLAGVEAAPYVDMSNSGGDYYLCKSDFSGLGPRWWFEENIYEAYTFPNSENQPDGNKHPKYTSQESQREAIDITFTIDRYFNGAQAQVYSANYSDIGLHPSLPYYGYLLNPSFGTDAYKFTSRLELYDSGNNLVDTVDVGGITNNPLVTYNFSSTHAPGTYKLRFTTPSWQWGYFVLGTAATSSAGSKCSVTTSGGVHPAATNDTTHAPAVKLICPSVISDGAVPSGTTTHSYIRDYHTTTSVLESIRSGNIVYNESVMPVYDPNTNTVSPIQLMYDADRIVSVNSWNGSSYYEYKYGVDYTLTSDGKLQLIVHTDGVNIPVARLIGNDGWALYSSNYTAVDTASPMYNNCLWWPSHIDGVGYACRIADGSRDGVFNNSRNYFPNWQINVTYTHDEGSASSWSYDDIYALTGSGYALHNTYTKLNGSCANIVFVGDSITDGWNATSKCQNPPASQVSAGVHVSGYPYPTLVNNALVSKYGSSHVNVYNEAVSATTSFWLNKSDNRNNRVKIHNPDLVVIAYGMNDLDTGLPLENTYPGVLPHMTTKAEYKANIQNFINDVRSQNPDCEFILVSSVLSNELLDNRTGDPAMRVQYLEALNELANSNTGVAVFDMMNLHEQLIARKGGASGVSAMTDVQFARGYASLTGSNVHHVNDFMMRLYAQSICKMLGDPETVPVSTDAGLVLSAYKVDIREDIEIDLLVAEGVFTGYDASSAILKVTEHDGTVVNLTYDQNKAVTGYYVFPFSDIAPQNMADSITVQVRCKAAGSNKYTSGTNTYTVSVKSYCDARLTASSDNNEKTLIKDMLSYGRACQDYINGGEYPEGAGSFTADIPNTYTTSTAVPAINPNAIVTSENCISGSGSGNASMIGATVTLLDTLGIKFYYTDFSNAVAPQAGTVKNASDANVASVFGEDSHHGKYVVIPLMPTEMGNMYHAQMFNSGNAAQSRVLTYSMNSYFYYILTECGVTSSSNPYLYNVVTSLMKYGVSANAFNGTSAPVTAVAN